MLPAMDLYITWGEDLRYWHWYLIPEARFGRIAELIEVCWLEILGRMNTHLLSPSTRYSAYIVFKKGDGFRGFKATPVEAIIEEVGKEPSRRFICFDEAMSRRDIVKPKERPDGWMEVELGEFFNEEVLHNDEIEIRVLEIEKLNWKRGLIILGIEIRPTQFHRGDADDPVLIDNGKKRLWFDKASGKRCIMLPAMDLSITWGEDLRYWHWYLIPEARFGRIAELIEVCWLEILGRMNTHLLSPSTRYSAYIVFKKGDGFRGFKATPVEAIIEEVGKEPSRRFICFDEAMSRRDIVKPEERKDGWMEVELGEFFTEEVLHNDEIEIRVLEIEKLNWKHGLIILGIEIRPTQFHRGNADKHSLILT